MTVALGHAPALAVLAGGAAVAIGAAGADPAALVWTVMAVAFAALATAAGAWRTLGALRRAATTQAAVVDTPSEATAAARSSDTQIEIDHKVRNTLQVMSSLLSLELQGLGPSRERAALLRVQARLFGMSLAHQSCSSPGAPPAVRLDLIAAEIADHLFGETPAEAAMVAPHMMLDAVSADPERASAFALFVNEALMAARDDLARGQTAGSVSLTLRDIGEGACLLTIVQVGGAGSGGGAGDEALGARLMTNCAAQLGAVLAVERDGDRHEVRLSMPPRPRRAV